MLAVTMITQAQVGIGTTTPDASAQLHVASTTKGLLIPQLTAAQRTAMAAPANGILVYQTDGAGGFYYNTGTPAGPEWVSLSAYTLQQNLNTNGKYISSDGSNSGLRVFENGTLIVKSTSASGELTEAGAGTKMIWYSGKGAFRAGTVDGSQWDPAKIGFASIAAGRNCIASADYTVAMGNNATASGNGSVVFGSDVTSQGQNGCFLFGDAAPGATLLRPISNNSFTVRASGGTTFYTNTSLTTGVFLSAGANAWSTMSDINRKENFVPVDGDGVLKKIAGFNLTSWNYKGQDPKKYRHYGPMAQEFYAAFGKDEYGTIGNDTTINQADFDGINLIAIQALEKRTGELQTNNQQLTEKHDALQKKAMDLDERLKKLETRMR